MVAALSGQEQESRLEDVDVDAWSHRVEELNLHRVNLLLCEIQGQLVQITIFTLKHEKECLVIEDGVRCNEQASGEVVTASHRQIADTIFMVGLFVDDKVLTDDKDATGADITWDLNQGVGRFVHREDVFADHMIQTKVHLVKSESLLEVARVDSAEILI